MRSQILLLLVLCAWAVSGLDASAQLGLPWSKVTVQVVDEDFKPVSDAKAVFCFDEEFPKWGSVRGEPVTRRTDKGGYASAAGHSGPSLSVGITKDGFYLGGPNDVSFSKTSIGCWLPWNSEHLVVLKRVVHPCPMYAKHYRGIIPAFDKPVGFDMVKADWCAPYGKGEVSHFVFVFSKDETIRDPILSKSQFRVYADMTFPNAEGGIQEVPKNKGPSTSMLRFPRNAPGSGYEHHLALFSYRTPTSSGQQRLDGIGYIFRTAPASGEFEYYGKIDGSFNFFAQLTPTPGIEFTYYFNPDRTDNLEFDLTKNLLTGLDVLEEVRFP